MKNGYNSVIMINKRNLSIYLLWTVFVFHSANAQNNKPPYAVDGMLSEPRIFSEGIVSTDGNEFGGVFTPDGKEFYFARSVPRSYFYIICVTRFVNGKWTEAEIAPFSGRYRDFDAVISPDGSKLFFISDRPTGNGKPKKDYDIWFVNKTPTGWSEPQNLGAPINRETEARDDEWFISMTKNGTIYFASANRPDSKGGGDIYRSRLVNGKYQEPENMGDAINSANYETEPYIAPDESFLLFSSYGRDDSYGGYDIYISYNQHGVWSKAKNLGPKVNTPTRDYSPRLTPDGKYLFFTSERNFATNGFTNPLSYDELQTNLQSILNGNGNIYQIEINTLNTIF